MNQLRAGLAQVEITPPVGSPMDGYGDRTGGATGIHDPLQAQVLILASGETTTALITCDLLAVDSSFVDTVRTLLAERAGQPPQALIVAASHTHSGPAGFRARSPIRPGPYNPWREEVASRLVSAYEQARCALAPASLSVARLTAPPVAANRLDPAGPVDNTLNILFIRGQKKLRGLLLHYACHPTVLGADNRLLSADFVHSMRAYCRRQLAPSGPVLFVNGAAADISTRFTRREQTFAEAERLGEALGRAASAAAAQASPLPTAQLAAHHSWAELSTRRISPAAAEQTYRAAEQLLARLQAENASGTALRLAETGLQGARAALALARRELPPQLQLPLEVIAVGELALLSVPGELFAELGHKIRRGSPFLYTLVAGYSNGYADYILPRTAYDAESYEARRTPLAAGSGEAFVDAAVEALKQTKEAQNETRHR